MSLMRTRSSGLLPKLRKRYYYGALTVVMAAIGLFAAVPVASAASLAKPAGAMAVSASQAGNLSPVPQAARLGSLLRPDIGTQTCGSGNRTWVHLWRSNGANICVGGKGTVSVAASGTYEFCAGNNYGSFKYHYSGRPTVTESFTQGYETGFGTSSVTVTQVTITKWQGSFKCF